MNSSLLKTVLFTRISARLTILLCSLIATLFGLMGPYFQKLFVDQLTGVTTSSWHPLWLITAAFVAVLCAQGFFQLTNYLGAREALHLQGVFANRLYQKTLDLRVDTMSHRPVGEIIQIYATDVPGATVLLDQTLPAGASTLFPLILAPFAISLMFDLPLWPTLCLMVAISFLNTAMAFRQSKFFYRFKKLAGERIALVNEWIQNIRTIRILGWISFFEKNIFAKRQIETINRVRMVTNGQVMNAISSSVTFMLNVVTLASLIYFSKHTITSGELLALLWIVGVFLTKPFRQMPWFFTFAFDSWTSLQRLQNFLNVTNEEVESDGPKPPQNGDANSPWILDVKNMNLSIGGKKILKNIDLKVHPGELVALVGEVGSGKSMLLLSLLGETGATADHYLIKNREAQWLHIDELRANYSFVPQEGFIMSASLRENVAFLYDIEAEKDPDVQEALRLAQFEAQQERADSGLATEIGERGVNLSGGQRQRVGLARVHYHRAPIILLDDCLSAVDVDTEEKLFTQLIDGAWHDRTRLLVTHRLSVLDRVDRILFMKEGHIIAEGTYQDLMQNCPEFREYTLSVEGQDVVQA